MKKSKAAHTLIMTMLNSAAPFGFTFFKGIKIYLLRKYTALSRHIMALCVDAISGCIFIVLPKTKSLAKLSK